MKINTKSIICVSLLFLLVVILAVVHRIMSKPKLWKDSFMSMDTAVTMSVSGDYSGSLRDIIESLDESLDAYSQTSELYILNRAGQKQSSSIAKLLLSLEEIETTHTSPLAGKLIELWSITSDDAKLPLEQEISDALKTVDKNNLSINGEEISLSNGCYLNFGYCAKGYACDLVKSELERLDAEYAVVSLGSSSLLFGEKPDGKPFKTAVTNPFSPSQSMLYVETAECVISTSGGYERYSDIDGKRYGHIFDLETGYPAETDLASVTVISQSGILTDVLATEIYIGGTKELQKHIPNDEYQIIAVDMNRNIYVSPSLSNSVTVIDASFTLKE